VLDNAQAPDTPTGLDAPLARLVDLVPQVLHGQVLVTSRDASWEDHASLAELEVFAPTEAVAFLLARSGSSDQPAATAIAELLGLLPLALEQAGAYVRETRIPLATYLHRLRQFPALTIAKGRPRDRNPADTVATTWQVSVEQVRPIPGASELLEVCAFLGPEEIPRDLFGRRLDPVPEELAVLAADPFALDEAVGMLRRFGLVKADEQTLTVHRLVQAVTRQQLDGEQERQWATAALHLLRATFPADHTNPDAWTAYARLLPHALTVTGHAERPGIDPTTIVWLLNQAGGYLYARGRYSEAKALHGRALAIQEAADDPGQSLAATFTFLGLTLRRLGDLDGARMHHQHALHIREARLGKDRPDTAISLNNLASVLRGQGDLAGARALHERALAIREARLGADHPDTATSLNDLATVLRDQGDPEGARALHQRALAIREARLGVDHPDTVRSRQELAVVVAALDNRQ